MVRAVVEAGRDDIALYTGNDDNIVTDLVTPYRLRVGRETVERRIVGGLLGHWSVWTRSAVELLEKCQGAGGEMGELLRLSVEVTDSNAAFFDAANSFKGCIAGLHEVLRRQGICWRGSGVWMSMRGLGRGSGRRSIGRIRRIRIRMMTSLCRSIAMNGCAVTLLSALHGGAVARDGGSGMGAGW